MLRVELTRPGSTCNGVLSVTYFSTKTSKLSLFVWTMLNFSKSFVVMVCRSRKFRIWADFSAGLIRLFDLIWFDSDDRLESMSASSESSSKSGCPKPDSLWEGCDDRSDAGLLELAKHPESRGNLWRSNFLLVRTSISESSRSCRSFRSPSLVPKGLGLAFFSVSVSSFWLFSAVADAAGILKQKMS